MQPSELLPARRPKGWVAGNLHRRFGCLMSRVSLSRNFAISLAAVLLGNAIYFLVMPYLPPAARHRSYSLWPDLGLLIDFWICLVMYGVIALLFRLHIQRHPTEQIRGTTRKSGLNLSPPGAALPIASDSGFLFRKVSGTNWRLAAP